MLLKRSGECLQLEIMGKSSVARPVQLFIGVADQAEGPRATIGALDLLLSLSGGRDFPHALAGAYAGSVRLNLILSALDGWRAGHSQREIAVELFGRGRVDADWGRGADYLKSQVRRLIRRGRWLMEGGYRTLLR